MLKRRISGYGVYETRLSEISDPTHWNLKPQRIAFLSDRGLVLCKVKWHLLVSNIFIKRLSHSCVSLCRFDAFLRRFWRTIMWRSDAPLGDVLTLYCVTLWCTIAQRFWHTNVWRFRRTIVWRGDSLLYDVLTLYRVTVKRSNVWRFRLLLYDIFDALLCDVWIYYYNGFTHSCVTF